MQSTYGTVPLSSSPNLFFSLPLAPPQPLTAKPSRMNGWHFRTWFSPRVNHFQFWKRKFKLKKKKKKKFDVGNLDSVHRKPEERDKKRHHCWAAVGHDFKSDMCFYEVPGNTNGKMSQRVYSDLSANREALDWSASQFRLRRRWWLRSWAGKIEHCADVEKIKWPGNLLQLSLFAWTLSHRKIAGNRSSNTSINIRIGNWDDHTTRELIYEGWTHVSQHFINKRVASMPERMDAVIAGERKMTGY